MQVSTIPTVKAQLVDRLTDALAGKGLEGGPVQVAWAWPGAETRSECVFLGQHPELEDVRVSADHGLAGIKAGRQHRQESYTVPITIWVFRPSLTADSAEVAERRAFELADPVEDIFADDPKIGLSGVVQTVTVADVVSTLFPFEKGWGCSLVVPVDVQARLT